jgi:hypothetical protein
MTEINAKAVQLLLTLPEDGVERFSEHFDVPVGIAKGLRLFWPRALTGKCTTCGIPTRGAKKCKSCKRRSPKLLDPRSSVALLRDMDPHRPVHRAVCSSCGGGVWWSAGFILRRCRRFGYFRPPEPLICEDCMIRARREEVELTHRPFGDLLTNGR